jgi:hypothetical protein
MRTNFKVRAIATATAVVFATALTGGCATPGADVAPSYVPQGMYENTSCATLARDIMDVQQHAAALSGQLDDTAQKDKVAVGVALILFWPAAFFVSGGDKGKQAELASSKGQFEAMSKAYRSKGCEGTIAYTAPAAAPAPEQIKR